MVNDEVRTVSCHKPKSVGAAAQRRVLRIMTKCVFCRKITHQIDTK